MLNLYPFRLNQYTDENAYVPETGLVFVRYQKGYIWEEDPADAGLDPDEKALKYQGGTMGVASTIEHNIYDDYGNILDSRPYY